eukprot:SAG22_NODE_14715_length_367_cov_0.500000_1_plen_66_part_10
MLARLRSPHASQPEETDASVISLYHGFASGALNYIFTTKCRLLCEVCGLRYRIIDIDLDAKPEWFG